VAGKIVVQAVGGSHLEMTPSGLGKTYAFGFLLAGIVLMGWNYRLRPTTAAMLSAAAFAQWE